MLDFLMILMGFFAYISLPVLITLIPLALFLMAFKALDFIRRNKYPLAILNIVVIITVLAVSGLFCEVILMVLLFGMVLIVPWLIHLFTSGTILLLLIIYLVYDVFFEKKLSIFKRIAVVMLMAIYTSPFFFFAYTIRDFGRGVHG